MYKKIISGIYCIENTINGKKYVGKSISVYRRFANHKGHLKKGIHDNPILQYSWNKYGEENFSFYILEECERDFLPEKEIFWIEKLNSYYKNGGFNLTQGMDGVMTFSEEVRKKMSEMRKGDKAYWFGKRRSDETRRKISRNHADVSGTKNGRYGKPVSDETRRKISIANSGTSPEKRERMSFSQLGKKRVGASSKYIGVSVIKKKKKNRWTANVYLFGEKTNLGYFYEEIDAAKAYDSFMISKVGLGKCPLNFDYE